MTPGMNGHMTWTCTQVTNIDVTNKSATAFAALSAPRLPLARAACADALDPGRGDVHDDFHASTI